MGGLKAELFCSAGLPVPKPPNNGFDAAFVLVEGPVFAVDPPKVLPGAVDAVALNPPKRPPADGAGVVVAFPNNPPLGAGAVVLAVARFVAELPNSPPVGCAAYKVIPASCRCRYIEITDPPGYYQTTLSLCLQ